MGFYQDHVVPYLVHLSMRQARLAEYRRRVIPHARGRVLELGVGSGMNFPLYAQSVTHVIGLDPSPKLLSMARRSTKQTPAHIELLEAIAEALPVEDNSVDTVLTTWTLCSVPDVERALSEARRVLRPDGQLLFVEHGLAAEASVRRWQQRLTPAWKRLAGGCHLDRPIDTLITAAGFRIERLKTGYMEGPKLLTFLYEGCARPI